MNNIPLLLVGVFLAGIEPFLPMGSVVVAWASVAGIRRNDWMAMVAVFVAGIVRDVVLVGALGVTSVVAMAVWTLSAIGIARFERPFLVVIATTFLGSIVLSLGEKQPVLSGAVGSAFIAVVLLWIWERMSSGGGIKVRQG